MALTRHLIRPNTGAEVGSAAVAADPVRAEAAAVAGPEASNDGVQLFPSPQAQPGTLLTFPTRFFGAAVAEAGENARPEPTHEIAVIVLTQANRPTELACAIASVRAQRQVDPQLVLVVNGAPPPQPDPSDRLIVLPENVGIPAARNCHGLSSYPCQV